MRLLTGTEGKQTRYGALVTYCLKFGNMKDILHRILTMWVQLDMQKQQGEAKWTQYQERLINCINSCLGVKLTRSEHCIEQSERYLLSLISPPPVAWWKKKSLVEVVSGGKSRKHGGWQDRVCKSRPRRAIMELTNFKGYWFKLCLIANKSHQRQYILHYI